MRALDIHIHIHTTKKRGGQKMYFTAEDKKKLKQPVEGEEAAAILELMPEFMKTLESVPKDEAIQQTMFYFFQAGKLSARK